MLLNSGDLLHMMRSLGHHGPKIVKYETTGHLCLSKHRLFWVSGKPLGVMAGFLPVRSEANPVQS